MNETKFMRRLMKALLVFSFSFDLLCLFLLSKGIGGYLVVSIHSSLANNLDQRRLVLILLLFLTAYIYLNFDKHNSKIEMVNDPKITVKSLRFSQIAMIIIITSVAWLVS